MASGHWGFFGGAIDEGELPEAALARELQEELDVTNVVYCYFTEFTFDYNFRQMGTLKRTFYSAEELLKTTRVTLCDAFALALFAMTSWRIEP